jgi:hypothetical protein
MSLRGRCRDAVPSRGSLTARGGRSVGKMRVIPAPDPTDSKRQGLMVVTNPRVGQIGNVTVVDLENAG